MGAKSNADEIAVETAVETAVLLAEGLSGEDPEAHLSWSNTEHVPEALPDGTPGFTAANQLMGRMARLCYDQLG